MCTCTVDCGPHGNCPAHSPSSCTCSAGWGGIACDQCLPGFAGPSCSPCPSCVHGNCSGSGKVNGSATCDCDTPWRGALCDSCEVGFDPAAKCLDCLPGFVGPSCSPCPSCIHGNCSGSGNVSGSASCNCDIGWAGSLCTSCDIGFFGPTCSPCPSDTAGATLDTVCMCKAHLLSLVSSVEQVTCAVVTANAPTVCLETAPAAVAAVGQAPGAPIALPVPLAPSARLANIRFRMEVS